MRSAASLIKQARLLAGYSRAELARAAGVAPSTIGRIESGDVDPTWTLLSTVLAAAGFRLGDSLTSLGDESAVDSAANALSAEPVPRKDTWTESWRRAGLLDDAGRAKNPARVAAIAGLASELPARRGTRRYLLNRALSEVIAELERSGAQPSLTGPAVFDDVDPGGAVVYVTDPSALDLPEAQPYQPSLTAIPRPDQLTTSRAANGVRIVSPPRALVDSYASGGRIADRADAYATRVATR